MFVRGQYSLIMNLFILRQNFERQFTHCQFLCATVKFLCVLVEIILDFD